MKALLLAAGLGTRLRPLTDARPKALVEINHKTLLEYALDKLQDSGISDVIINIHHFSGLMKDFIQSLHYPQLHIEISDESEMLLDTGGGMKKAAWFFDDEQPFLVYNVDVFTDLNIQQMLQYHRLKKSMVTLAVSRRKTSRYLLLDKNSQLLGWKNEKNGEKILEDDLSEQVEEMAFSGIHIVSPLFLSMIQKNGAFPIIPEYVSLCRKCPIFGFDHTGTRWIDLGKPESLMMGKSFLEQSLSFH